MNRYPAFFLRHPHILRQAIVPIRPIAPTCLGLTFNGCKSELPDEAKALGATHAKRDRHFSLAKVSQKT